MVTAEDEVREPATAGPWRGGAVFCRDFYHMWGVYFKYIYGNIGISIMDKKNGNIINIWGFMKYTNYI